MFTLFGNTRKTSKNKVQRLEERVVKKKKSEEVARGCVGHGLEICF